MSISPQYLMQQLQPYKGLQKKIVSEQTTGDIIAAILEAHKKHINDYKKISHLFKGATTKQTAKNIYDFLKKNIQYRIEPGSLQTVKSASALLSHGYGDCKHYAKFAAGILQNLGIPFAFRFASYKLYDQNPAHVFIVVNPGTDKEIWIDPVLPKFDQRKQYYYSIDKTPTMALYSINGIGATKKQKRQAKRSARKAAGKTLGQRLKKGVKIVAKVAASPARNAFLLLVRINFANLAVKLNAATNKAPGKLKNFWEGIGGNINALLKAINKGKTKKRIFGDDSIGAAPAGAAVAAAPILAAVTKFLKDIGIEPGELLQIGKDAVNSKVQQLVKNKLIPQTEQLAVQNEIAQEMENSFPASYNQETTTTTAPQQKNMVPIIVGGLVVAYLLTRKK